LIVLSLSETCLLLFVIISQNLFIAFCHQKKMNNLFCFELVNGNQSFSLLLVISNLREKFCELPLAALELLLIVFGHFVCVKALNSFVASVHRMK